jgi:cytochrome c biogenesis protein CcmG/thiol:disulfide interchange protein DsbE
VRERRSSIEQKLVRALAWCALSLTGCSAMAPSASTVAGAAHGLVGAAAPAFELPSPDAKRKVSLAQQSGKVVLIDFWATWCGPCHDSFPVFQRLANKFGQKMAVIGISVDDDPAGIPGFAEETGAKFQLAWDDGQVATKSYGPTTMPTTFVVDQHGIVRFVHAGFRADEEHELEVEISSLLK